MFLSVSVSVSKSNVRWQHKNKEMFLESLIVCYVNVNIFCQFTRAYTVI